MQTYPNDPIEGGPIPAAALALLQGAIADRELSGAAFDDSARSLSLAAEPGPDTTKAKTCRPTRNPCCKGAEEPAPQATQAKTCKPTRNPCCKGDEEPAPEATKEKTCKKTRNPCCKEAEQSASGRGHPGPDVLFL